VTGELLALALAAALRRLDEDVRELQRPRTQEARVLRNEVRPLRPLFLIHDRWAVMPAVSTVECIYVWHRLGIIQKPIVLSATSLATFSLLLVPALLPVHLEILDLVE
jgi:hypothetical protein